MRKQMVMYLSNIEYVDKFTPYSAQAKTVLEQVRSRYSSIQYPSISHKANNQTQEQIARDVLNKQVQVGVYGRFVGDEEEVESLGKFWTMGDETASVGLVYNLAGLGVKQIELRLSPPYPLLENGQDNPLGSFKVRKEKELTDEQKKDFDKRQAIAFSKLAFLLSGFDPDKKLPQTVMLGNCKITVRHCDDQTESPPLTLVFSNGETKYNHCGYMDKCYLTVMPYRFNQQFEAIYLQREDARVDRLHAALPDHSIIPHQLPVKFDTFDAEKQWFQRQLSRFGIRGEEVLSNTLALVSQERRFNKLHTGLVYGLHHALFTGDYIVSNWLDALKEYGKQIDKPVLVFIKKPPYFFSEETVSQKAIVVCSAEHGETYKHMQEFIHRKEGLGVCYLPKLPQLVFHQVLCSTNLPVLAEGANLTSFLLQTGHAYLSVKPTGNTLVPTDIGDPLEAFKAEFLSNVLIATEDKIIPIPEILKKLYGYVNNSNYGDALKYLRSPSVWQWNLDFLSAESNGQSQGITISGLLKKGANGELSEEEREVLLDVLDKPVTSVLQNFISQTLDEKSPTAKHFLITTEVTLAFSQMVAG